MGFLPGRRLARADLHRHSKSGTNQYQGSVNYFFQNQNLVAKDEHVESSQFSSHDTAFTIGGPIMRNSLWAFGSLDTFRSPGT